MGSRMASALSAAGYELHVYDVALERARKVGDQLGAHIVDHPVELGERAGTVLLSLPGPSEVRAVVTHEGGLLSGAAHPQVIVDLSTVDPVSTRERAAKAADHGVGYLDAPVLGRPSRCGQWTLPVGGDEHRLQEVRPVLDVLAQRIIHVGPVGSGNVIKLLNNLMFGAINAITVESMAIAQRLEVDLGVFFDTIAESGAASVSNLFLEIGPKIVAEDTTPDFTLDLLQKDNTLALEMARAVACPAVVGNAVTVLNGFGQDRGLGELDSSALIKVFEPKPSPEARDVTDAR